jgi:transcriptional regulator with XRE-family HTH domain
MLEKADIAERLKFAMQRERVSNTELAELCGVSLQAVTGWLQTGRVSRKHFPLLSHRLRVSVQWLMTGSEHDEPATLPKKTQRLVDAFHLLAPPVQAHVLGIVESLAMPAHPRYTNLEQKLADATKRETRKAET